MTAKYLEVYVRGENVILFLQLWGRLDPSEAIAMEQQGKTQNPKRSKRLHRVKESSLLNDHYAMYAYFNALRGHQRWDVWLCALKYTAVTRNQSRPPKSTNPTSSFPEQARRGEP
uniref:Uncharacterized protein n=1 Tax=Rhipicephalus zambeziensis TaxID=60191 RepID=A0A224Y5L0_9ACAR